MSTYLVRPRWPGPEAFKSPEALRRALREQRAKAARALEKLSQPRVPSRSSSGSGKGPGLQGLPTGLPAERSGPMGWSEDEPIDFGIDPPSTDLVLEEKDGDAWEVAGGREEIEDLAARESDVLRVDREVGFHLPPDSQPVEAGDLRSASQRERLGIAPAVHSLATGRGVKVAVIDSGLDHRHEEFAGTEIDHDLSHAWYYVKDPQEGVTYIPRQQGKKVGMRHYHGTAVAGLLAGGSLGVAPGATLVIHNVFFRRKEKDRKRLGWRDSRGKWRSSDATLQSIEQALLYSGLSRADIFLLSLGTKGYNGIFEHEMGILDKTLAPLVVAAAGNDGHGSHFSPGDYRNVLAVGAVDWQRELWEGTSVERITTKGSRKRQDTYLKPDLFTHGVDIRLPVPKEVDDSGYLVKSGTSFAAPIVAGVAALVLERYRAAGKAVRPADLKEHLLATADDFPIPEHLGGTGKLLNPARALEGIG